MYMLSLYLAKNYRKIYKNWLFCKEHELKKRINSFEIIVAFTSLLIKQFLRYFFTFLSLFLLFQEVVGKGLLLYLFCIWKNFVSPLPSTWTMDIWWELFSKISQIIGWFVHMGCINFGIFGGSPVELSAHILSLCTPSSWFFINQPLNTSTNK